MHSIWRCIFKTSWKWNIQTFHAIGKATRALKSKLSHEELPQLYQEDQRAVEQHLTYSTLLPICSLESWNKEE